MYLLKYYQLEMIFTFIYAIKLSTFFSDGHASRKCSQVIYDLIACELCHGPAAVVVILLENTSVVMPILDA